MDSQLLKCEDKKSVVYLLLMVGLFLKVQHAGNHLLEADRKKQVVRGLFWCPGGGYCGEDPWCLESRPRTSDVWISPC